MGTTKFFYPFKSLPVFGSVESCILTLKEMLGFIVFYYFVCFVMLEHCSSIFASSIMERTLYMYCCVLWSLVPLPSSNDYNRTIDNRCTSNDLPIWNAELLHNTNFGNQISDVEGSGSLLLEQVR